MALIDCPECATQVSSAAVSCPQCGYPIAESVGSALGKTDKPASNGAPVAVGIGIVLAVLYLIFINYKPQPAAKGERPTEAELVARCLYLAQFNLREQVSVGKRDDAGYLHDVRHIADACQTLYVYREPNGVHYVEGAADKARYGSTFRLKPGEDIWCGTVPEEECGNK